MPCFLQEHLVCKSKPLEQEHLLMVKAFRGAAFWVASLTAFDFVWIFPTIYLYAVVTIIHLEITSIIANLNNSMLTMQSIEWLSSSYNLDNDTWEAIRICGCSVNPRDLQAYCMSPWSWIPSLTYLLGILSVGIVSKFLYCWMLLVNGQWLFLHVSLRAFRWDLKIIQWMFQSWKGRFTNGRRECSLWNWWGEWAFGSWSSKWVTRRSLKREF